MKAWKMAAIMAALLLAFLVLWFIDDIEAVDWSLDSTAHQIVGR